MSKNELSQGYPRMFWVEFNIAEARKSKEIVQLISRVEEATIMIPKLVNSTREIVKQKVAEYPGWILIQ